LKVWFKNKRAKCRQLHKQFQQNQSVGKTETPAAGNSSTAKKTTNAATKLKTKVMTTNPLLVETSNLIKAQNPFTSSHGGSTKV